MLYVGPLRLMSVGGNKGMTWCAQFVLMEHCTKMKHAPHTIVRMHLTQHRVASFTDNLVDNLLCHFAVLRWGIVVPPKIISVFGQWTRIIDKHHP